MSFLQPNEVFAMVPIQAMLVIQHIEDLRRAAAAERQAHPETVDIHQTRRPSGPRDPRRALARVATRVSRVAAATASRLDPAIDEARLRRRTTVPGC